MIERLACTPTSLLGIGAPGLPIRIIAKPSACMCYHGPGAHPSLLGRNEDGTWRSAVANVLRERAHRDSSSTIVRGSEEEMGGAANHRRV
eukprot:2967344-Pyramimonas_sp.AAC.1